MLPVSEHHVSGEVFSLHQQVLNGSLCFSVLSLQSGSGIRQLIGHDSEVTTSVYSP